MFHLEKLNKAMSMFRSVRQLEKFGVTYIKPFDDNGLTRRVSLLKELINTSLESSNGIEDYVSKILNATHKLRNIGFEVNDEWLGTLMLACLPDDYGIEKFWR